MCLAEQFDLYLLSMSQTFRIAFLKCVATVLSSCAVCPLPEEHHPGLKGRGRG